jgi:renalase
MIRIAVIGAGLAGLTLAQQLRTQAEVVVFDKARGVGGRMATRRNGHFQFDHGAQFFTARSLAFRRFLQDFRAQGIVQEWRPRVLTLAQDEKPYRRDWFESHYVAVPGMTALCKALAAGSDVRLGTAVGIPQRQEDGRWLLPLGLSEHSEAFDWVLCTTPAPQARELLPPEFVAPDLLAEATLEPCIALLLGFEDAPPWRFDAARIKHPVLNWVSCEISRPGRSAAFAVTVQSTPQWAERHLHDPDDSIAESMLSALLAVTGQPLPPVAVQEVKRWSYAQAQAQEKPLRLFDAQLRLGACGDWTRDGRVEGAFLSALDLAEALQLWL